MKSSNEVLEELDKSKSKYRAIIQAGIAKWIKDFQEGKIKINSVEDLKKLIEMDIDILKEDFMLKRNTESKTRETKSLKK